MRVCIVDVCVCVCVCVCVSVSSSLCVFVWVFVLRGEEGLLVYAHIPYRAIHQGRPAYPREEGSGQTRYLFLFVKKF